MPQENRNYFGLPEYVFSGPCGKKQCLLFHKNNANCFKILVSIYNNGVFIVSFNFFFRFLKFSKVYFYEAMIANIIKSTL